MQVVFKTDSTPLFFPEEFQISADTLRQKGKFSFSLKRVCFSPSKKQNQNKIKPKTKPQKTMTKNLLIQSNSGGGVSLFYPPHLQNHICFFILCYSEGFFSPCNIFSYQTVNTLKVRRAQEAQSMFWELLKARQWVPSTPGVRDNQEATRWNGSMFKQ